MHIDIKDGIVSTSEGHSFRKSDIYQVSLTISDVKAQNFILEDMEGVTDQKVFYKKEYGYDSGGGYWVLRPENPDLRFDSGRQEYIEKILDKKGYERLYWFTKTATYKIFDKNDNEIGVHKYSKNYEDRLYLLAQWAIDSQNIKDLSIQLLTKEKTNI